MSERRLFHSGLVLSALLLMSGAAPGQQTADTSGLITPHVKQVYKMDCAFCHGDDGSGKTEAVTSMKLVVLDYTDPKSLAGKTDQQLFEIIRKGQGQMPPEDASRAKDDDVRGLVAYLRSMSKGVKQTAATAPGAPPAASPNPNPNR